MLRPLPCVLAVATLATCACADQYTFRLENVMGTSLELHVTAPDSVVAGRAEEVVLDEIDRLSAIFNAWSPDSEFSRWMNSPASMRPISAELFDVLQAAEFWRQQSGGAFNPGAAELGRIWKSAASRNTAVPPGELTAACQRIQGSQWELDSVARAARRTGDHPVSLDAIAKGWIVEHAGEVGLHEPGVTGIALNIGGDLRVWGDTVRSIRIASPLDDGEGAEPMSVVELRDAALATSGGYRRGVALQGVWRSHIVDPRTGQPASHVLSASVIGTNSATVDALATTFCVLDPAESLRLAASAGVQCLLVTAEGHEVRTAGWPGTRPSMAPRPPVEAEAGAGAVSPWPKDRELVVSYELEGPGEGRYHRPYVAIWIEDAEGFPVRTLVLWLLQSEKGQRWLPDLKRWYHADEMRRLVDPGDLVGTVSAATRGPGKYHAVWNGLDDQKKPVKAGKYTLYIESAREHGTYQLIRKDLTIGLDPFKAELKGNVEIKAASIEYRTRTAKP